MMPAYEFNTTIYINPDTALRLVQEDRCYFNASSLLAAVTTKNEPLVDALLSKGCAWPASISLAYISNGNLAKLVNAHEQGCPLHQDSFE